MIYRFDAYSLDTDTLELKSGAETIKSEPQVLLLLQFLIEKRLRVVSKDDIIDAVWDGRIVSDAALAYAVKQARNLVGDDGKTQTVIRTLPRRGFRFVAEVTEGSVGDEAVAKPDRGAALSDKPLSANRRWRIPAIVAALVVIIVVGGLAWWQSGGARFAPSVIERTVFPLPDNPSIAVLPFKNLSGDAFAEVFLVDVAENVATALSRLPEMLVIAPSSTFSHKDKTVDGLQVAEELGARYVLEGSVKRSGDQVRITATLFDTQSAHKLWGEAYNRDLQDASAVQHEIALNVVTVLETKLVEEAGARIVRGNTHSPQAYSLVRRGLSLFRGSTEAKNAEAWRLFQEAVELDPDYSIGWHLLSLTYNASFRRGWGQGRAQEQARAEELARNAIVNNPSASGPYILLSTVSLQKIRYKESVAYGEKAVALAPNDAMTVAYMGRALYFAGRPKEALPLIQRAIRLSPYTPPPILFFEGLGYHSLARYGEEINDFYRTVLANATVPLGLLAVTSADLGRMDEARVAVQAILNNHTGFSAKELVNRLAFRDSIKSEHALAILIQLGLPE